MHSNRQAPSRDIALAFAQGNRVRHFLSGGHVLVRAVQRDQPISGPQNLLPNDEGLGSVASQPNTPHMLSTSAASVSQIPEFVDAGEAGLWQMVGEGPLGLVQRPNTVTQYLGLDKHKDYSKYGTRCTYFNSVIDITVAGRLLCTRQNASPPIQSNEDISDLPARRSFPCR